MLAMKFTDAVQAFLTASAGAMSSPSFSLVTEGDYDLKLVPSARFSVDDETAASLTFRLTTRSKVQGSNSEVTRNYYCPVYGARPITGPGSWSEDSGAALRESARAAFAALESVMLHDREGRYSGAIGDEHLKPTRIVAKGGGQPSVIVLEETPKFLVWVPPIRDKPLKAVIMVVDRRLIQTQTQTP